MIDKKFLEGIGLFHKYEIGFLMKMARYLIIEKEDYIKEKFWLKKLILLTDLSFL